MLTAAPRRRPLPCAWLPPAPPRPFAAGQRRHGHAGRCSPPGRPGPGDPAYSQVWRLAVESASTALREQWAQLARPRAPRPCDWPFWRQRRSRASFLGSRAVAAALEPAWALPLPPRDGGGGTRLVLRAGAAPTPGAPPRGSEPSQARATTTRKHRWVVGGTGPMGRRLALQDADGLGSAALQRGNARIRQHLGEPRRGGH